MIDIATRSSSDITDIEEFLACISWMPASDDPSPDLQELPNKIADQLRSDDVEFTVLIRERAGTSIRGTVLFTDNYQDFLPAGETRILADTAPLTGYCTYLLNALSVAKSDATPAGAIMEHCVEAYRMLLLSDFIHTLRERYDTPTRTVKGAFFDAGEVDGVLGIHEQHFYMTSKA